MDPVKTFMKNLAAKKRSKREDSLKNKEQDYWK
jgi:hypothetical protein